MRLQSEIGEFICRVFYPSNRLRFAELIQIIPGLNEKLYITIQMNLKGNSLSIVEKLIFYFHKTRFSLVELLIRLRMEFIYLVINHITLMRLIEAMI